MHEPIAPGPPAGPVLEGVVRAGEAVLVQASLRATGAGPGTAVDVVRGLLDLVGPLGTVLVPTYTAFNTDPSRWAATRGRAVPESAWDRLRATMPPFDPATTPSEGMGVLAETVRTWPGARRSAHPQTSFAAAGADAAWLTDGHDPTCHLGPASPLGRLAALGERARVLMLGVPWERCTVFHLAEYLVPDPPRRDYECVVRRDGERTWFRYEDVLLDDDDFGRLGADFEASAVGREVIRTARVGGTVCRSFPVPAAVAFATQWLPEHRGPG